MSIRTLLVDDERPARRKMSRFLEAAADFEIVGEAGDGAEAMEAVERLRPDVVFLDVQMPQMDGFRLPAGAAARALECRRWRRRRRPDIEAGSRAGRG